MLNIVRQTYIDRICHYLGKDTIIILTGQRRVGKSCLLRLLRDHLANKSNTNIIYINKEKHLFDNIVTYSDLNTYVDEKLDKSKTNFLLIDEVQDIVDFERSLRSYYDEPNIEIIVTGSNSAMLSSDLSTKIGGRYTEIYVHALSYIEFLTFHNLSDNDESLSLFLELGGLPGLVRYGLEPDEVRQYQSDVLGTVLLKDVIMRQQIRNVPFLQNLTRFLADNVGKLISANSISKYMKSQGETITTTAITNYIKALCQSYVMHQVNRYDIHGKRLFESNDKYYFEDHGLRNALCGSHREGDIEKILENVVYNHLKRIGYKVTVGQLQNCEIDFVCWQNNGKLIYIQVAYLIANESTRMREFGNLLAIHDNYPKYVISLTPMVKSQDYEGVTHLHLRKFLTEWTDSSQNH